MTKQKRVSPKQIKRERREARAAIINQVMPSSQSGALNPQVVTSAKEWLNQFGEPQTQMREADFADARASKPLAYDEKSGALATREFAFSKVARPPEASRAAVHQALDEFDAKLVQESHELDKRQIENLCALLEANLHSVRDPYESVAHILNETMVDCFIRGALADNFLDDTSCAVQPTTTGGISWNAAYPKFWTRQWQRVRNALGLKLSGEVPNDYRATAFTVVLKSITAARVTFTVQQPMDGSAPTVRALQHSK